MTLLLTTDTGLPDWVAQHLCASKSPDRDNQDALVITDNFVAVLDGMSSPLSTTHQAPTGGVFARTAAQAMQTLPADASARAAINHLTVSLSGIRPDHAGPTGAVAAIYSRLRGEVWRVGDIHVRIGEVHHTGTKRVDAAMASFRAAVNAARIADGLPVDSVLVDDPGLVATTPLLLHQAALANTSGPWGYGVLDGTPVPDGRIDVFEVPAGCWVVLATDGFLSADSTLDLAEARLREALQQDPLCIDGLEDMGKAPQPGTMPDDRTYVRLRHEIDLSEE